MKLNENSSRDEILQAGINEFFVFLTLFLLGFGYLIACFSKTLAGGYYLFLFLGSLLVIILRKIEKRRNKK